MFGQRANLDRLVARCPGRVLVAALSALVVLLALAGGCRDNGTESEATGGDAPGVTQRFESGPVTLTVRCARQEAKVADPITLDFRVEHPADVKVVWPAPQGDWGEFEVNAEEAQRTDPERSGPVVSTRRYALSSYVPGAYTVPELTLRYEPAEEALPADDAVAAEAGEIATHPIDVEIVSVLAGDEEPTAIRMAGGGPIELIEERGFPWGWLIFGVVLAGVLGGLLVWWLRWVRNRPAPVVIIPAHRWALDELDRLAGAGLIEKGKTKEYYFRLSWIVRGYIERRFGVLAPDMTTDEFMDAMRNDRRLDDEHRRSLEPFLTSCDMVKFAQYEPGSQEIEGAFDAGRLFVLDTADYGATEAGDGAADALTRGAAA